MHKSTTPQSFNGKNVVSLMDVLKCVSLLFLKEASMASFFIAFLQLRRFLRQILTKILFYDKIFRLIIIIGYYAFFALWAEKGADKVR